MPGKLSSTSPCFHFVQRVTKAFLTNGGHDATCLPTLSITSARPGLIYGKLAVEKKNVNRLGFVHGGLICTLVDTFGSLALASKGCYSTGISTDIHSTFVQSSGKPGDEIVLRGEVISMGKSLATTRIELRHPVTDALLAYGSHTKFMRRAWGHEENVEFDDEGQVTKGKKMEEWTDVKLD